MALCNFFAWLEKEVEKRDITELDACHFTEKFRQLVDAMLYVIS